MTVEQALTLGQTMLDPVYGPGESQALTQLLMEDLLGFHEPQLRMMNHRAEVKGRSLDAGQYKIFLANLHRVQQQEPIQYVLGEAWFDGLRLRVDASVLIPRPETEELVQWVHRDWTQQAISILDIGSGSGCIPLALKKRMPGAQLTGVDVSEEALNLASGNAGKLSLEVGFMRLDFLDPSGWTGLSNYHVIVSNPPYIPLRESAELPRNVSGFEPAIALFVPDDDPLIFYRAIAEFAASHLHVGGAVYVEIHEHQAAGVEALFNSHDFETVLKIDMQGRDRMIRASK